MTDKAISEKKAHLVCPKHGTEVVRLVEDPEDDSIVVCPGGFGGRCVYTSRNYLKYPEALVVLTTGETVMQNVLTGEVLTGRTDFESWERRDE